MITSVKLTPGPVETRCQEGEEAKGDQISQTGRNGCGHIVRIDVEEVGGDDDKDHDDAQGGAGNGGRTHGRGPQEQLVEGIGVSPKHDGEYRGKTSNHQSLCLFRRGGGGVAMRGRDYGNEGHGNEGV